MFSFTEEDFFCPVCHDIFKDPVLLSCSHSFCRGCLQKWWSAKKTKECPVCKKTHSKDPPSNLALKHLCETVTRERHQRPSKRQRSAAGSEDLCSLHAEKLKLFCQECQHPVCVVCLHSEKHTNHISRPIDEAALDHKEQVQKSLKPLLKKLEVFNAFKTNCDQTVDHIKIQTHNTERRIKEQFKKLHHFLRDDEEARITALREEEQQKSQMVKEKIECLNRAISTLSHTIRVIEELLTTGHISFLQNHKATMERARFTPKDPKPVTGALIDVAKHLGNLTFRVWNKMKDIYVSYTPVILDPNTTHPCLILSDDLTSVRRVERQQLPDNPERFDYWLCLLGSEGFNSGTHTWDVDVGDSAVWELGVAEESLRRKKSRGGPLWIIESCGSKYSTESSTGPAVELSLKQHPQRIRVQLDWNRGKLSFSDPDTNTHIHTFTHAFQKTIFPYVFTPYTLTMLPGKINATLEQCS